MLELFGYYVAGLLVLFAGIAAGYMLGYSDGAEDAKYGMLGD